MYSIHFQLGFLSLGKYSAKPACVALLLLYHRIFTLSNSCIVSHRLKNVLMTVSGEECDRNERSDSCSLEEESVTQVIFIAAI